MTTAELAERQSVRQQSMAATVAELRSRGLIEREPHATDGRKAMLKLSAEGRRALDEQRHKRAAWLSAAIARNLDRAEQETLARAVALLARLHNDASDGRQL